MFSWLWTLRERRTKVSSTVTVWLLRLAHTHMHTHTHTEGGEEGDEEIEPTDTSSWAGTERDYTYEEVSHRP